MARSPRPWRVLATYQDQASAQQAAFGWILQASGVAVEHQVAGTTRDRPWAVTATRDPGGQRIRTVGVPARAAY